MYFVLYPVCIRIVLESARALDPAREGLRASGSFAPAPPPPHLKIQDAPLQHLKAILVRFKTV